jgi:hypothetical protein
MMDNHNDTRKWKIEADNLTRIHLLGQLLFQRKPPCRAKGFGVGMATEKISSPSHARNDVIDN